jgi:hypothetical protein
MSDSTHSIQSMIVDLENQRNIIKEEIKKNELEFERVGIMIHALEKLIGRPTLKESRISIEEGIFQCLNTKKHPCNASEIADYLKEIGIKTASKNFNKMIGTLLCALNEQQKGISRFSYGKYGLSEWENDGTLESAQDNDSFVSKLRRWGAK